MAGVIALCRSAIPLGGIALCFAGCGSAAAPSTTTTTATSGTRAPSVAAMVTPAEPAVTPSPRPLPAAPSSPPPPGIAVLYIGRPDEPTLIAVDWNGRPVGTIGSAGTSSLPNADGSLFAGRSGSTPAVTDIAGRIVAPLPATGFPVWTDDGKHLCMVTSGPPNAEGSMTESLVISGVDGSSRVVASNVGTSNGSDSGDSVTACSTRSDLVVTAHTVCCHLTQYSVRRLSTGGLLRQRSVGPGEEIEDVESRDARLVAENGPEGSVVVESVTGKVVARLPGLGVLAFADNAASAVVSPSQSSTAAPATELIHLRERNVVWSMPGADFVGMQPGGSNVLVAAAVVPGPPGAQPSDGRRAGVAIIRPDGSRVAVADGVLIVAPR